MALPGVFGKSWAQAQTTYNLIKRGVESVETGLKSALKALEETAYVGAESSSGKTYLAWGGVSSAGAKIVGRGFSVKKLATGRYEITLTKELTQTGIAVVSLGEATTGHIRVGAGGSKKAFEIQATNATQSAFEDHAFTFIIIG